MWIAFKPAIVSAVLKFFGSINDAIELSAVP
jgi:hypothetical protein